MRWIVMVCGLVECRDRLCPGLSKLFEYGCAGVVQIGLWHVSNRRHRPGLCVAIPIG